VRRLLKFLHTMGAIGLMGGFASLIALIRVSPPPASLAGYVSIHAGMAEIATWLVFPSCAVTLIAGLLAIAANRVFHNAGWAWIKLATGVLMFEGTLAYGVGPIQREAELSAQALAGQAAASAVGGIDANLENGLWALLAVATANVVLGVWRPRIIRPADAPAKAAVDA
jgi:hypothetical protein